MKEKIISLAFLAYSRSGDKGSSSNIGVIAYTTRGYDFLQTHLSTSKVGAFFQALHPIKIKRYELPNLLAFNFVLEGVLDGGGSRSLRLDSQGKALGQAILEMPLTMSLELYEKLSNDL